jgi:hypothetical protein
MLEFRITEHNGIEHHFGVVWVRGENRMPWILSTSLNGCRRSDQADSQMKLEADWFSDSYIFPGSFLSGLPRRDLRQSREVPLATWRGGDSRRGYDHWWILDLFWSRCRCRWVVCGMTYVALSKMHQTFPYLLCSGSNRSQRAWKTQRTTHESNCAFSSSFSGFVSLTLIDLVGVHLSITMESAILTDTHRVDGSFERPKSTGLKRACPKRSKSTCSKCQCSQFRDLRNLIESNDRLFHSTQQHCGYIRAELGNSEKIDLKLYEMISWYHNQWRVASCLSFRLYWLAWLALQ